MVRGLIDVFSGVGVGEEFHWQKKGDLEDLQYYLQ